MFSLFGCGEKIQKLDGDGMVREPFYAQISQDEAKLMMKDDDGHVIVDVRRADEYAKGHIPGAILIPNEEIGTDEPEELPDKKQIILVYCRTGRRSKEAAQKLADMGYVNVYEFGGIEDWTGDIVTDDAGSKSGDKTASLSFESFDGGGPEFNVVIADEGIVSYDSRSKYRHPDHEKMNGSGYDVTITFTGIKPGETNVIIEERSPIADNLDHRYRLIVDEDLKVKIEEISVKDLNEASQDTRLYIGTEEVPVTWEENESVNKLKSMLPLDIRMSKYGDFEQVGSLGYDVISNDEKIDAECGDIMLYSGDQIVLFYGTNSWEYTRLGRIDLPEDDVKRLLGNKDVNICIE